MGGKLSELSRVNKRNARTHEQARLLEKVCEDAWAHLSQVSKSTSKAHAAERACLLTSIGRVDPPTCSRTLAPEMPPTLSRSQRYEHGSAEKAARTAESATAIFSQALLRLAEPPPATLGTCDSPKRVAKDNANQKTAAIYPPPIPMVEVDDSSPDGPLVPTSMNFDDCSDDCDCIYVDVASSEDMDNLPPLPLICLCSCALLQVLLTA